MRKSVPTFIGNAMSSECEALLQRIVSKSAMITDSYLKKISSSIKLTIDQFILTSEQDKIDELALFNFYPVSEQEYFIQLSFIPELNKSAINRQLIQLTFNASFFSQWPEELLKMVQPFKFENSVEQSFAFNAQVRLIIEQILLFKNAATFNDFLILTEQSSQLLRIALEALTFPDVANKLPACSFLDNSSERDKVLTAQHLIIHRLDQPYTIKELSREVGMNECYLKKGFKAMFGKTIHEFQQFERIEKAKLLLQSKDLTVNEVAYQLGFGSASHFSTSFKRIAGMKPCELLQ